MEWRTKSIGEFSNGTVGWNIIVLQSFKMSVRERQDPKQFAWTVPTGTGWKRAGERKLKTLEI